MAVTHWLFVTAQLLCCCFVLLPRSFKSRLQSVWLLLFYYYPGTFAIVAAGWWLFVVVAFYFATSGLFPFCRYYCSHFCLVAAVAVTADSLLPTAWPPLLLLSTPVAAAAADTDFFWPLGDVVATFCCCCFVVAGWWLPLSLLPPPVAAGCRRWLVVHASWSLLIHCRCCRWWRRPHTWDVYMAGIKRHHLPAL